MSVEMTVSAPEMNAEGSQQPPEEPPKQDASQHAAPKKTWTCSKCGATIDWLPPKSRHLHPSKVLCLKCLKAKKGTEAPADVPSSPPPAREAPRHAPQRRPAGGPQDRRAQAPRGLTLEIVEACALRVGIDPDQVDSLLACIRSRLTPSSDK